MLLLTGLTSFYCTNFQIIVILSAPSFHLPCFISLNVLRNGSYFLVVKYDIHVFNFTIK